MKHLQRFNFRHEVVNINLKHKPDWFLAKNPVGLVPVLELGNKIVYESTVCDEYLEDVYGHNKLLPADLYLRARTKMLMEYFSNVSILELYTSLCLINLGSSVIVGLHSIFQRETEL